MWVKQFEKSPVVLPYTLSIRECMSSVRVFSVCSDFESGSFAPSKFKVSLGLGTSSGVLGGLYLLLGVLGNHYLKMKSRGVLLGADPWSMSLTPTNGESVWLVEKKLCKVKIFFHA